MRTIFRVLGVVVIAYACVMAVMGMQYLFDRGDLRKASQVISQYKPKGSDKTILTLMAERSGVPESRIACDSHLLSRYEGRVEVDCRASDGEGHVIAGRQEFRFEVDVVGAQLRALNDATKALIDGVTR